MNRDGRGGFLNTLNKPRLVRPAKQPDKIVQIYQHLQPQYAIIVFGDGIQFMAHLHNCSDTSRSHLRKPYQMLHRFHRNSTSLLQS